MHVYRGLTANMRHRRNLVHPQAVVTLVVSRKARGQPRAVVERPFDGGKALTRHQDIYVVKEPPDAGGRPPRA